MTDSELFDLVKNSKSWRVSIAKGGTFLIADDVRYTLTDNQAELLWGWGHLFSGALHA